MKKYLYIITLVICLLFSACGMPPVSVSKEQSSVPAAFDPSFDTDTVTVYDIIMGRSWVENDGKRIAALAANAQIDSWKAMTALEEQISAVPNYAFDFGNGTCVGLLGDGYILLGTGFEYLSEDLQSYRIVDGCQYQVPVEFTDLLKECTMYAPAAEAVPAEPEEALTAPEEISAVPEEVLIVPEEIQAEPEDASLESLMTDFMNGGLEGCMFNDGSEASERFRVWSEMLGGEAIPLETETPQSYWESWCEHVEMLYTGNGYEFFIEQDYPVSAKYIELKYGISG